MLGVALLAVGGLIASGRLHGRRKAPVPAGHTEPEKKAGWAERTLSEPRLGLAVIVGALCGMPGGSYIAGLHHLITGKSGTAVDVIAVIFANERISHIHARNSEYGCFMFRIDRG